MAREDLLARTFVDLADIGSHEFDLAEVTLLVAQRCVELFDASAVGVFLADAQGHLRLAASFGVQIHNAELFELDAGEGPCLESYRTSKPTAEPNLAHSGHRWRHFESVALTAGFASVHAIPILLHNATIGALSLFGYERGNLTNADMLAARALVQAMALTIDRQPERHISSRGVKQPATDDHILIEQAKGTPAGLAAVGIDEAYSRISRYARHHHLAMVDVCQQVVHGSLNLTTFQETSLQRRRTTHNSIANSDASPYPAHGGRARPGRA